MNTSSFWNFSSWLFYSKMEALMQYFICLWLASWKTPQPSLSTDVLDQYLGKNRQLMHLFSAGIFIFQWHFIWLKKNQLFLMLVVYTVSIIVIIEAGEPLLWRQAERVGVVQPGEEKASGRPYSSLSVPKGDLQESWRGTFYKSM